MTTASQAIVLTLFLSFVPAALAQGDDPSAAALRRYQLQRQQQHDVFSLKLQQSQRSAMTPPAANALDLNRRQLELDQQLRLYQLHQQQQIDLAVREQHTATLPDAGRAQLDAERLRAGQQSRQQLQLFDWELQALERPPEVVPAPPLQR
jgi:hypothetical protein